ncbi:hypothetical protein OPV22_028296 [Ensete ventricosum]|uniref:Purple acid phosphatase N-terminal domain-containing protein n=1 Tax=Ensete ventricosum TaxID=4639 RepID=A0AAV8QA50_ENSVE|nr:hypothetical protein OPV22_028296 [Ensete ventricosum]
MDLSSSISTVTRHTSKVAPLASTLVLFLLVSSLTPTAEAYDPLDPNGNITIKWDVMQWTPDGYIAVVCLARWKKNNPSSDDMEHYVCVEGDSPHK